MTDAPGPVARYLIADHERLDVLLRRAVDAPPAIDMAAYAEFRRGLLRHIGIEEKILLPVAQRALDGVPLPVAARLRRDHGALAALLVPVPDVAILTAIRTILTEHNQLEEGAEGAYAACEHLAGPAIAELAAALQAAPEVPVSAPIDFARVADATRRALVRAGYDPATLGV
jgi:hypothetical protein